MHGEVAVAMSHWQYSERDEVVRMTLGGADGGDGLLIGPILDGWDKHMTRRDAKRAARQAAKAKKQSAAEQKTR